MIGIPIMPLTSQISASANPLTYVDYYIAVDVSSSMGIGSTAADMNALYARTSANGGGAFGEAGCVFGCHVYAPGQKGPKTNEQLAHLISPKINLRIDAAVAAIQNIISIAQSKSGTNKNIRIGLYALNHDPNNSSQYYTVISPPSSDYATLITLANQIELGNNQTDTIGDSDFQHELSSLSGVLPSTNGTGASAISPKNYVFLIGDGLADNNNLTSCFNSQNNTCSKPIDPSFCNPLKPRATVGVIYTVYNPIFKNNDPNQGTQFLFNFYVGSYVTVDSKGNVTSDQMATNLQACSTDPSKFYFKASDGPGINTAMTNLFASTLQDARLTQ